MKITPLHGSGQRERATNNGRSAASAAVHPPHDRAGQGGVATDGQPSSAAPDRPRAPQARRMDPPVKPEDDEMGDPRATALKQRADASGSARKNAASNASEMRFWMEARRFLTRGTLDRALDLLASAADAAEATEPTAGTASYPPPHNAAARTAPSGGRPETDASGRTGGAAKAVSEAPDASVDRSIMRNTFARVASYLIGGEDVMAMPLGRVRTLARERTEQGHVLAAIASRYHHLPHTTVVGDLLPPSELEQIVEQARKDAEHAV